MGFRGFYTAPIRLKLRIITAIVQAYMRDQETGGVAKWFGGRVWSLQSIGVDRGQ